MGVSVRVVQQIGVLWADAVFGLPAMWTCHGPLSHQQDWSVWISHYFRHMHLYPLLHEHRLAWDPFLALCDGTPGNTNEKNYSMHSCC